MMTWNSEPSMKTPVPGDGAQTTRIREAIENLEEAVEKDAVFLWTGGKEAQVIADLLLYAVGDEKGKSPVPWATIDTGNQFDEMYEFREDYLAAEGDKGADTIGPFQGIGNEHFVMRYDTFLKKIINNRSDPRGYHGKHTGEWKCPECGEIAELDQDEIICEECGVKTGLHSVQKQNRKPEEWGVPESCGALKVKPMKDLIKEKGFDVLITGVRATDPLADTEDHEASLVEEREDPAEHTRHNPLVDWEEANVWAYLKMESVSYPVLYDQGYRHTDTECCTDDQQVSEYGEGGRDAEKEQAKDKLQEMGYV